MEMKHLRYSILWGASSTIHKIYWNYLSIKEFVPNIYYFIYGENSISCSPWNKSHV